MITIIVNSCLIIVLVTLYVRVNQFFDDNNFEKKYKLSFNMLVVALALGIMSGAFAVLTAGKSICYLFYTVQLFSYLLTICQIIMSCRDIIGINQNIISDFVSFLTYATIIIYFLNTIVGKCKLTYSKYGVFFKPEKPLHVIVLYIIIFFGAIVLFTFIIFRKSANNKRRIEHEINLLAVTLGSCIAGFLMEFLMVLYAADYYYDVRAIFYVISAYSYFVLIRYHRSIDIKIEDYESDLSDDDNEVSFVLNDEEEIIFVNKRAEVLGHIYADNYVGRKFTDVFLFNESELELFNDKTCKKAFGTSAEYVPGKCFVNIVVRHRFDSYDNILTSTINVYNMESSEDVSLKTKENYLINGELSSIIDKSREITKSARVLLIDENITFLNDLHTALDPYEMIITRAIGGYDGLERVLNGEFDIIFIADEMVQISAEDTCKRIRANQGMYYEEIPIIYMTNKNINDIFMQMLEAGFSDYMDKSLEVLKIDSTLTKWVWKRQSKNAEAIQVSFKG